MKSYIGTVQKGVGRGRELGFPTVNIALPDKNLSGIYAAFVQEDGKRYQAAAFADPARELLEAHILDFSGELYAKKITIHLVAKIRDTENFDDEQSLRAAIARDIENVRKHFEQ